MNTANKITIARIFLVPVFMFFLLSHMPFSYLLSAIIFVIAAATDGLDGFIARKYNQITKFGKFIDPLADKLLITAALVCLVEQSKVSSVVTVIIITREFVITGFRILAISEGKVIAASMWGKVKTVSQIVAVVSILMQEYLFFGVPYLPTALIYISAAITLYSGYDYIIKNKNIIKTNE